MKITVSRPVEIEVAAVAVTLPVRYGTEDIAADFPLRSGDTWQAVIDVDTGQIRDWPIRRKAKYKMCMKVCDAGIYRLLAPDGTEVATLADYVPHGLIPSSCGDYVELQISREGVVTNWPKQPTFDEFFPKED